MGSFGSSISSSSQSSQKLVISMIKIFHNHQEKFNSDNKLKNMFKFVKHYLLDSKQSQKEEQKRKLFSTFFKVQTV